MDQSLLMHGSGTKGHSLLMHEWHKGPFFTYAWEGTKGHSLMHGSGTQRAILN